MKQVELLAPAGSYEKGVAAIQNGCDAVYLSLSQFGARAFATNFKREELLSFIQYAHAYGSKVYVTLNTLIRDEECEECLQTIAFLYEANADALIIQDLGVLYYVRQNYPDFEIHASTQMHIVNGNALLFLHQMGVARAVLAREVPIEEIKQFATYPIELEVFIHGALCVSYSGQCLMSYMIGGRSGNRGECAQCCRKLYALSLYQQNKIVDDKSYLLSLKDLNVIDYMNELMDCGITSFKIEGRMKKTEYVAMMTSLYRKAIDQTDFRIGNEDLMKAKTIFNRGYTKGWLFHESDLSNTYRPNHVGIEIGKIIGVYKNKIQIKLTETLYQNDGIRILMEPEDYGFMINKMYLNQLLVNKAVKGDCIELDCLHQVKVGSKVLKTSDSRLEKEIAKSCEDLSRKIKIHGELIAKSNQPCIMIVSDNVNEVEIKSVCSIETAIKRATTKEEIAKQVHRTNNTIFEMESFKIKMDESLFIPVKLINQMRRDALHRLYELRVQNIKRKVVPFRMEDKKIGIDAFCIDAKVLNEKQLIACLEKNLSSIYVEDIILYNRYKDNDKVLLCSSKIEKGDYSYVSMIQDIGGIHALDSFDCDTSLNIFNAYSCRLLINMGAKICTLSHELNLKDCANLIMNYRERFHQTANFAKVIYGRVEVMVSEHCPIHTAIGKKDKSACSLCRNQTYALQDTFGNEYPMKNDGDCRMHLYNDTIKDEIHLLKEYQTIGINHIRLDFTFESYEETLAIIDKTYAEVE